MPFEPSTVTTVVGSGSDDPFMLLAGLDVRPDGDVVVASATENAIITVTPTGATRVLAGGPYGAPADQSRYLVDGRGSAARFHGPADVALDAQGMAYVADMSNCAIRKVAPDGTVTTLAGARSLGYVDADGTAARFRVPRGVAVDAKGTVFVADSGNHCIRAITPTGRVSTYAGGNAPGWANGLRLQARFRDPSDLAFGPDGSLYVADGGNHRIRRITPDGIVSDAYGAPASAADGTAQLPAIDSTAHLVVNREGDLFLAHSARVYRLRPDGTMTILAGYGRAGYADGSAESAYFGGIRGLGIDPTGRIFVAEHGTMRIRMIARR
jgi:sugar lactone lactonase YvrE